MKIVIPSGPGHVGSLLARDFATNGHEVVILTRSLENDLAIQSDH